MLGVMTLKCWLHDGVKNVTRTTYFYISVLCCFLALKKVIKLLFCLILSSLLKWRYSLFVEKQTKDKKIVQICQERSLEVFCW